MLSVMQTISWFVYLASALSFVVGLHLMNSPATARKGNLVSVGGMIIATIMAIIDGAYSAFPIPMDPNDIQKAFMLGTTSVNDCLKQHNYGASGIALPVIVVLALGILFGAVFGVFSAKKVKMTAMPQLVSLFNTVGGGAAAVIALNDAIFTLEKTKIVVIITASLSIIIGSITFTGSLVAAGKLQGIISGKAITIPGKFFIDLACAGVALASFIFYVRDPGSHQATTFILLICLCALIFGISMVLPIGGADMPVVISVLNACTGTAVAMAGFVMSNTIMIVAGAIVGAAGSILSKLMADAMNRSLLSVLAGGFGDTNATISASSGTELDISETSAAMVAVSVNMAKKVIMVPGYGLAAAGAQHALAELSKVLNNRGCEVLYAIHPVAGRMPGHMNVLLAEANIPYEALLDLEEANDEFSDADLAIVIGANDVTNPAARSEGSPISGMPILNVDECEQVVVIKRGAGKGYAGIENELYGLSNTSMLYGDALQAINDITKELQ